MAASHNGLFGTPDNIIDRNIIPFAKAEWETIVSTHGDIEGAEILKRVLEFKVSEWKTINISVAPVNIESTILSIITPSQTLMANMTNDQKALVSSKDARTIFYAQLILCLKQHHTTLTKKSADEKTLKTLNWIPEWCDNKAIFIRNQLLDHPIERRISTQKQLLLHSLVILAIAAFYYFFTDRNKSNRQSAGILMCLALMHSLKIEFERYINDPLTLYCKKSAHADRYGKRALTLLDQITPIARANTPTELEENKHLKVLFNHRINL